MAILMCKVGCNGETPCHSRLLTISKSPDVKKYDLSSVDFFMVGAAPVSAELIDQLVRVLPKNCRIGQGYGTRSCHSSALGSDTLALLALLTCLSG